jgi:hypothetical protein
VSLLLLAAALAAGLTGQLLRRGSERRQKQAKGPVPSTESQEGYVVSGALGLLALMLGFTLAMAVDRFDQRRLLVLEEANAIGTTYLRAQLFAEPHRTRLSKLLVEYTDNRIALATATRGEVTKLIADNDRMITELWIATAAAFDSVSSLDFSTAFLETMNNMINLDAARKTARMAHVPTKVLAVLSIYIIVTAGVLGYVLTAFRGRLAGGFLVALLTLLLALIIDLERPTTGGVRESQAPMELLRASLKNRPPVVFDRWRNVPPQRDPRQRPPPGTRP